MPQIQPGQVQPGQGGAPKLYGTEKIENSIPFQERLMRLFKPQEFVTIKNIDDEPIYWQYLPADSEQESFSEDGMQKMISREQPEMWMIPAGETEVLVGASAYMALDVMYKNVTAKKTLKRFADPTQPQFNEKNEHLPKNFNFADGGLQEAFLQQAYLGKAVPTFAGMEAQPPVEATVPAPIDTAAVQPVDAPVASQPSAPIENDLPKPKTTIGAALAPVEYADPDAPAKPAKETLGASKK
jgi:hypothetical protein